MAGESQGNESREPVLWDAETRHTFDVVEFAEYAPVARLQVYKGTVYFSTDFMLLYKFEEGWRIVSKIFAVPSSVLLTCP
jgi:hypothetical protein